MGVGGLNMPRIFHPEKETGYTVYRRLDETALPV
jgi:hypothetical protein